MSTEQPTPPPNRRRIFIHFFAFLSLFIFALFRETEFKNLDIFFRWVFAMATIILLLAYLKTLKISPLVRNIINIPLTVFTLSVPLWSAASSLVTATAIVVMGSALLPLFFVSVIKIDLSLAAQVYLSITTFSIIATNYFDHIVKFYHYTQHKDYRKFSQDAALFALDRRKIKFVIFLLYFLGLIVSNLSMFTSIKLIDNPQISTAILQSFATYLAFDRMGSNMHLIKQKKGE
ncbi:hypothetical protein [Pedobacter sp. Hv1]|uniref:hypothetical protein n=1 Tax=Pedobacter sp. Hv1 TaxID=1740090 RepID=UPI0006D8D3E7|nr:hypothetical protein [Pedobacter sp. Hv1]KQB99199.1 hypothetical protein AQF98_16605 [Pedobacter sp. Hv1]